jgi:hypothetical protein
MERHAIGSDDCKAGLMCVQDVNDVTQGICLSGWDGVWYVNWDNLEDSTVVELGSSGKRSLIHSCSLVLPHYAEFGLL